MDFINRDKLRDQVFLAVADRISLLSTCKRAKVGAVIVDQGMKTIVAIGYNGAASGLENSCERNEQGNCGCIHAELNSLLKVRSLRPQTLYVTVSPCEMCAKAIINAGNIKRVFFEKEYRNSKGKDLLTKAGVNVDFTKL